MFSYDKILRILSVQLCYNKNQNLRVQFSFIIKSYIKEQSRFRQSYNQSMERQRQFSESTLVKSIVLPEKFSYEFFQNNRYTISQSENYEALCNNGFIKLYTQNARVYWHAQNELGHTCPDWKFHVSVNPEDLKQAWNLLAGLFIHMKCRSGMKVNYLKESIDPHKGRQITVYVLKYCQQFKNSAFANQFDLSISDEHSQDYWVELVNNIQQLLSSYDIRANGLADGDLKIGNYVSLRNEAFVVNSKGEQIYPPNDYGWNPLQQELPFNLLKFKQEINKQEKQKSKFRSIFIQILLPIFTIGGFLLAYKHKLSSSEL